MSVALESIRWRYRTLSYNLRESFLVLFLAFFALWLVLVPLTQLLSASFDSGTVIEPGDWTLLNYATVYGSKITYDAFLNTLIYATSGTLLSLMVGVLFAFLIERTDLPLRNVAWGLILIPMAMPGILFAMGWIFLLHPRAGLVNIYLRELLALLGYQSAQGPFNIHSLGGLIFLDGTRGVTTIFLIIVGGFRMMDPSLEEAAIASGASKWLMLRRITLPLLLPAIFAGGVYSFMVSLDSFELPIIIGLPEKIFVFTTLIYFSAQGMYPPDYGFASAFATSFLPIGLFLIYLNRRAVRGGMERFSTITGRGYRSRTIRLGKLRYAAFALIALYSILTVLAPFAMLMWASLLPSYQVPSAEALRVASFASYGRVLSNPEVFSATFNTLILTVTTATGTMLVATAIAWVVVRSNLPGRSLLDAISFLPQAIPSVIIALSLVLLYARPPFAHLPIYGTLWIIVLGLTTAYLSFGSRTMNGAIIQVSKELEESARVAGAGLSKTFVRIILPLVFPAFASGWIWVAAHAMRSFSIPLILSSHDSEVIAVRLWNLWERGDAADASALGVIFVGALTLFTILGRWFVVKANPQE